MGHPVDVILFLVRHLSNSIYNTLISGVQYSWASLQDDSVRAQEVDRVGEGLRVDQVVGLGVGDDDDVGVLGELHEI